MDAAEQHLARFLAALGFSGDPEMAETAARFTEFLRSHVPVDEVPAVSRCAIRRSGPIAIRDMPFHSLCAHHLLAFHGTVSVAYQPTQAIAGLGSVPRILRHFAQRPQLQERMTEQIAECLFEALSPAGIVVRSTARHMCVEMRGASMPLEASVLATRGEVSPLLLSHLSA